MNDSWPLQAVCLSEATADESRRGEHKQLSVDQRELIQQKEDEPSQEV